MDQSEAKTWQEIQQKDTVSFERYYKSNYRTFFLMSCKYIKDPEQAAEIVNDVFMKLWEDGHLITIESSLKSYIYRAVINRSINALHKSRRESVVNVRLDVLPEDSYQLEEMEENELKVRLYTAIENLPDQCRRVFEMSRYEGMKQQEIADRLEISIKTVKNHITIALKQLSAVVIRLLILSSILMDKIFHF